MTDMKACVPAAACALLLLLPACVRVRVQRVGVAPVVAPAAARESGVVLQTGVASWYGADFHGRTTANGEIYDMHKLTAAHPELPFHSIVEVENLENGRCVRVRINDRGPFVKDRVIDLSLAAALRLDMAGQGTARVNLRRVHGGAPGNAPSPGGEPGSVAGAPAREVLPAPFEPAAACYVQAGAFSLKTNAEELRQVLGGIIPNMAFRVAREDGLFKVISPRLEADACRDVLRKLAIFQLPGFSRESDAPADD